MKTVKLSIPFERPDNLDHPAVGAYLNECGISATPPDKLAFDFDEEGNWTRLLSAKNEILATYRRSTTKSPFRYPGGKSKQTDWILSFRPQGIHEYREPFVGGGGVFFALDPVGLERRWINDMHSGLMAVYTGLRDYWWCEGQNFISATKLIEPAKPGEPLTPLGPRGGKPKNARFSELFEHFKTSEPTVEDLKFFFLNRTARDGRVNYDKGMSFSGPGRWTISLTDKLVNAAAHLNRTDITCGSYEPLLKEPGQDVWIYLDPPYIVDTKLPPSSKHYQHGFTMEDHQKLAMDIRACDHRIALSYDDDGFVRSLYEGFRIETNNWKYSGTSKSKKTTGKELLILNY